MELDLAFPLEFLVRGTPVSLQAKRRESVALWKEAVRASSRSVLPDWHFASSGPIAVTLFYFPGTKMAGDVDNIVKPILDALCGQIYIDDRQVERILVQKFESERFFAFGTLTPTLEQALQGPKPVLYVRVSDEPFEGFP